MMCALNLCSVVSESQLLELLAMTIDQQRTGHARALSSDGLTKPIRYSTH